MTDVVVDTESFTDGYSYAGTLDYSTDYFWRVMAVEPMPGDWSATFCFQTEPAPAPPPSYPHRPVPSWVWTIIIGGLLVDTYLLVLLLRRLL